MNDTDRTNKIMKLKSAITSAKSEYDKLSGQLENYTETMKSQFGVSDIKEAKVKLEQMENEKIELSSKLDSLIPSVEEALSKWM